MAYESWLDEVFKDIDNLALKAIDLNNYLADNPEVSGKEYNSSKKIVDLLRKDDIEVEYPFGGLETAFKAEVLNPKDARLKAAILVEYDALPELGHACGHSVSGAISVLAGLALSGKNLPIKVDLIGTPDEEVEGGKAILVDRGIFDDYDMAIMIHMDNADRVAARLLAVSDLDVKFKGKSSHAAAAPWDGKNALNGMQLFFHAVDMLRQHVKPDVRIHGVITEGGKAANIVPELAKASFFIRSDSYDYLEDVVEQVKNCARGAAIATGTEVELKQLYAAYTELAPNRTVERLLEDIYLDLDLNLKPLGKEPFGSSDVGNVSRKCPTFQPTLSIVTDGSPIHTREFAQAVKSPEAYKAIVDGAKVITRLLIELMCKEDILKRMKSDYNDYMVS